MPRTDSAFHHWALGQFSYWEQACGGPDPHMHVAQYLAQNVYAPDDRDLQAWFIGLYIAPYNVPTAEVLVQYFPTPAHVLGDQEGFTAWVHTYWSLLSLRKERRPVRAPARFAEHVIDYAGWMHAMWPELVKSPSYEDSFEVVKQVRYNGRYATMKLYEALRRTTGLPRFESVDIRPRDGKFPRRALSWLYPEHAEQLTGNDAAENLALTNKLAGELREQLGLDWFNIEVMLCDYSQAYNRTQYPGRAHDSELGHLAHVQAGFTELQFHTLKAREALFPWRCLGEHAGWEGRRVKLGEVMTRFEYVWSDLRYDWKRSKDDLAHPVPIA